MIVGEFDPLAVEEEGLEMFRFFFAVVSVVEDGDVVVFWPGNGIGVGT